MIAPIKESHTGDRTRERPLAAARRAVAAMLFQRPAQAGPPAVRVSVRAAWALVAWIALVAGSYVVLNGWWAIDRY